MFQRPHVVRYCAGRKQEPEREPRFRRFRQIVIKNVDADRPFRLIRGLAASSEQGICPVQYLFPAHAGPLDRRLAGRCQAHIQLYFALRAVIFGRLSGFCVFQDALSCLAVGFYLRFKRQLALTLVHMPFPSHVPPSLSPHNPLPVLPSPRRRPGPSIHPSSEYPPAIIPSGGRRFSVHDRRGYAQFLIREPVRALGTGLKAGIESFMGGVDSPRSSGLTFYCR